MKFEVDFNNNKDRDDKLLEKCGCKFEKQGEYPHYFIDLPNFEDLEIFINKINEGIDYSKQFSAIVTFDSPVIFLDNKA
jgi:hypothetical protein